MNLLRPMGSTRTLAHRAYNRYTGGTSRRTTAEYPPSVFARGYSTGTNTTEEDFAATPPPPPEDREWDQPDPRDQEESIDTKNKQIQALEQKIHEMKENWKRASAETDNISKVMQKDVSQLRDAAAEKFATSLFPVSDALDMYLQHRPNFELDEHKDNMEAKGAFDGLEVSKKHFNAAMMSLKISEIAPQVGDNFDPLLHKPCFEIEATGNLMPGQVASVLKAGWVRERKMIRIADVAIAKEKEEELPAFLQSNLETFEDEEEISSDEDF